MIPYIADRLVEWAEWSRMRIDGYYGRGGGAFAYDEPMPSNQSSYVTYSGPWQSRCMETEEGVAWLRAENYQLGDAVLLAYRDRPEWSGQMQAECLRISRMTLWRRLDTSHALLLGYFIDRAVGLMPQTEDLRMAKRARLSADA